MRRINTKGYHVFANGLEGDSNNIKQGTIETCAWNHKNTAKLYSEQTVIRPTIEKGM